MKTLKKMLRIGLIGTLLSLICDFLLGFNGFGRYDSISWHTDLDAENKHKNI